MGSRISLTPAFLKGGTMNFKDELKGATWIISLIALLYFGGHVLAWVVRG